MSENVDSRLRELRADDEKLNKYLTKWATEKLKPIYEAYPDAGKTIPAILFGMKYAQDLEGLEVWELAFMAMRAGLSGERNKASAIKRGVSLAPYVQLRQRADTVTAQTTLQQAAEKAMVILEDALTNEGDIP